MFFKYVILLSISLIVVINSFSQTPTIGLIYSDNEVSDGYTLFTPETNNNVYLINNCGEKINEWVFNEKPSLTCYLLEDGTLLRVGVDSIQIKDWDNNLIWSYSLTDANINQHHDIEPLPNGNILILVRDKYTDAEIIAEGRNPVNLAGNFRLDKVIEIQPVGSNNANVVWEWKLFDHLIQDFDSTKSNFGVVQDSPELINLNFTANDDYTHVNSIDYNENLDQILLSARHLNEVYIIDHSTTTAEAAGHTDGNSGMGGGYLMAMGKSSSL